MLKVKCNDCGFEGEMDDGWKFSWPIPEQKIKAKYFCPACSKKHEAAIRYRVNKKFSRLSVIFKGE